MNATKTLNTPVRPSPRGTAEAGATSATVNGTDAARTVDAVDIGGTGAATAPTEPAEPSAAPPRPQAEASTAGTHAPEGPAAKRPARERRDSDSMAVASFVLGLAGLLVFNVVLGPCALVLGGLALLRGTSRRGRALFGVALGAADLIVLAAVTAADHTVSWGLAG